ncbi:MAG TPA: LytTR family DNA-binding domain-containing protein [Cryomorphaceae bacterium]|nr:LytTR family DNA-binding domain-containing protein [Cryomorphaceae bacterium]HKL40091.1 LytTR family DNA-binding domain-containing protein [Cryomorphaceae bacterium]
MTYLIVDDEPLAHDVVLSYAKEIDFLELAHQSYNAIDAIEWLEKHTVDLIILDIQMPKITGLSMLKLLKEKPDVIISSAYEEYALESFDLDVADYLLKPYTMERFYSAIQRVKKRRSATENKEEPAAAFFVKGDKKHHQLRFDEIEYVEGYGQYCKIHYRGEVILTLERLSKLEEALPVNDFLRVHKSYIAAIPKIQSISGNMIELENAKIPIGQSYRKSVKEVLRLK